MPRLTSKQIAQQADDDVIASATKFSVNWFLGRTDESYRTGRIYREDMWSRIEVDTLEEARAAVEAAGADRNGRRGLIYAVGAIGEREVTVFVDPEFEARRKALVDGTDVEGRDGSPLYQIQQLGRPVRSASDQRPVGSLDRAP